MKDGSVNGDESRGQGAEACTLNEAIRINEKCWRTFCTECGWNADQVQERMGLLLREGASPAGKQIGLVRRDGVWRMEEKMRAPG